MVQFHPVVVPKLRLENKAYPLENRKLPFDPNAGSMFTPKIGTPTGDSGMTDFVKGRVPGYTGYLPGLSTNQAPGKTFGTITRMDRDELESPVAQASSPGPWASTYRENYREDGPKGWRQAYRPPSTARDYGTNEEMRLLKAKFKPRKRDGELELRQLRLTSPTRRGVRTKPAWVVESAWLTPRTSRTSRADEEVATRPCSPYGRRPNRQDSRWQVVASYLNDSGFADRLDADLDKAFSKHDPEKGYSAGEPYETPKGWLGFGLRVAESDLAKGIFKHWHTTYYPCPVQYLPTVLSTGQCVMPGDQLIDGTVAKTCFLTQRDGVEKRDPHTPRKLGSASRISTTPSIRYAYLKLNAQTRNSGYAVHEGKKLHFVLQCKQMSGSARVGGYHRIGEQIGWAESKPKERISPIFEHFDIENYALRKASIVPYRLLVKVEDAVFMPAWTSTGEPVMVPEQSQKQLKWTRTMAPSYGSMSVPGLQAPFTEFCDPHVSKTVREGGLECPKPSFPIITFPENEPVRDRISHPRLHASTQPHEPETMVKPSSGWVEGMLPPSFKDPGRNKGRCVKNVMSEMKEKFAANQASLNNLFASLAKHGDGEMHKSDLGIILLRLNIIKDLDEPILDELWHTLDEDDSGSVSADEFASKFGLLGSAEGVMDVLKMKIGGKFAKLAQAFRAADEDKSGFIDKTEFIKMMRHFNLLDAFPKTAYEEIWSLIDRDGGGLLSYDEFSEKFAGADNISTAYGPPSGTRVVVRKHFLKEGTKEHKIASICDEGTACYAQQDWDKAEECYRRALALDPNHVVSMCCLSWLLLNHKMDIIAARGLMQRAAEINPHHPYVVWHKHYLS
jgi:Ca2+-binding EF-hand superfamily protein